MTALRAPDLTALAAVVGQTDGRIDYIAGGTDLIIERQGSPWANLIVDISQTVGLDRIEADAGFLRIGAGVTIARLIEDPLIGQTAPMLARAAAQFGSVQIRNRATLGGNIAGAMPAADLLPVLKCHAVKVEIQRRSGVREVLDFDAVVLGRGQTCLGNGDLILAVHLPLAEATGRISAFVKLGPRQAVTICTEKMLWHGDRIRMRPSDSGMATQVWFSIAQWCVLGVETVLVTTRSASAKAASVWPKAKPLSSARCAPPSFSSLSSSASAAAVVRKAGSGSYSTTISAAAARAACGVSATTAATLSPTWRRICGNIRSSSGSS